MSHLIMGIDEVGRGPVAGPLVIGACILSPRTDENGEMLKTESWQEDLTDSKQLSESRREKLSPTIHKKCLAFGLGWVPAEELDVLGISVGLKVAARRAIEDLVANFPKVKFDEIIIDGNLNFLENTEYEDKVTTVVKADLKIKEVSAASIIAKVARDKYMKSLPGKEFTRYEFARHKGYGTQLHWRYLSEFGPCLEHRWLTARIAKRYGSRPKNSITKAAEKVTDEQRAEALALLEEAKTPKNTTEIGNTAETEIADFLEYERGHKILARNFKCKACEIDIVSATRNHIYFTEVKYRSNPNQGLPKEAIDDKKLEQMRFSAELFMQKLSKKMGRSLDDLPSPILAVGTLDSNGELDWFKLTDED